MQCRGNGRRGFTLVELLIVIVIIGMLVGLAVPAIRAAQRRALVAKCTNYQSELGKAVFQYETAKHRYPGYVNNFKGKQLSWAICVFEYMGRADLWEAWRDSGNTPPDPVRVDQLVCPSDTDGMAVNAPLSYVVNTNVFRDRSAAMPTPDKSVSATDLASTQRVPMITERVVPLGSPQRSYVMPSNPDASLYGVAWPITGTVGSVLKSNHVDGAVVTFCDGHSEFVLYDADCAAFIPGPKNK